MKILVATLVHMQPWRFVAPLIFWVTERETSSYITGRPNIQEPPLPVGILCIKLWLMLGPGASGLLCLQGPSGAQNVPQTRTNLGQFTMHQYYRLRAHQIRCPRTFLNGGPPPPGPEQGFLLSAGETAPSGMLGFDWSIRIRLNLQRLIWTLVQQVLG